MADRSFRGRQDYIGKEVQKLWSLNGRKAILVDGDSFREIMGDDLGHSMEDRRKTPDE